MDIEAELGKDVLSAGNLVRVYELQREMQARIRSVPPEGMIVSYLGKDFIVYPRVFWPFEDSKALAENMVIKSGETVLDVGTGSGALAICAAYKGAGKVVAVDINPAAVRSAKENAVRHGFPRSIDVRLSNVFSALRPNEQFDVIIANLPFRNMPASDAVEAASWDTDLNVHKNFFENVVGYLAPHGRIYLAQANYGEVKEMLRLAKDAGFDARLLARRVMLQGDPRVFYAFELARNG